MNAAKPKCKWELYKEFSKNYIGLKGYSEIPLITYSTKYSKVNAYNLAILSMLPYLSASEIKSFFKELQMEKGKDLNLSDLKITNAPFIIRTEMKNQYRYDINESFFNQGENPLLSFETQFFIIRNHKQIIIAVRGTEPNRINDWLTDAYAKEVNFNEGKGQAHAGFYSGFKFVKKHLDKYFTDYFKSGTEVIITGHSLGGAIATLTAAYIRETYDTDKIMLYTYGSPRVGDKTFSDYYTYTKPFTYYRVVNDNDIVTMVPAPGMDIKPHLIAHSVKSIFILPFSVLDWDFDFYTHLGDLVHIRALNEHNTLVRHNPSDKLYFSVDAGEILKLSMEVTVEDIIKEVKDSVVDHLMTSYLPILANDLQCTIQKYLSEDLGDIETLEKGLNDLEQEKKELERSRDSFLEKARINNDAAEKTTDNPDLNYAYVKVATEASNEAEKFKVKIADQEILIKDYENELVYYENNRKNKQSYLRELIRKETNKEIEKEFEYHQYR